MSYIREDGRKVYSLDDVIYELAHIIGSDYLIYQHEIGTLSGNSIAFMEEMLRDDRVLEDLLNELAHDDWPHEAARLIREAFGLARPTLSDVTDMALSDICRYQCAECGWVGHYVTHRLNILYSPEEQGIGFTSDGRALCPACKEG